MNKKAAFLLGCMAATVMPMQLSGAIPRIEIVGSSHAAEKFNFKQAISLAGSQRKEKKKSQGSGIRHRRYLPKTCRVGNRNNARPGHGMICRALRGTCLLVQQSAHRDQPAGETEEAAANHHICYHLGR